LLGNPIRQRPKITEAMQTRPRPINGLRFWRVGDGLTVAPPPNWHVPEHARERPQSLDGRRRSVRGDQLRRRPREGEEEGHQRRPDERGGEADDARQREDDGDRRVCEDRGRRAGEGDRAGERDGEKEELAAEAVAEGSGEGREQHGGQQADEARDADRNRAADVVREDAQRDEVGPLGRDRRTPRELGAAEVRIAGDARQGGERNGEAAHPSIERPIRTRRNAASSDADVLVPELEVLGDDVAKWAAVSSRAD
jgi:hypothetical protein